MVGERVAGTRKMLAEILNRVAYLRKVAEMPLAMPETGGRGV